MFSRITGTLAVAFFMLLAGCAGTPQGQVNLASDYFKAKPGRIGVVMGTLPKVDTAFPGASCLLCIAAASAFNSKLTDHVRTLSADDLIGLRADMVALLKARGMDAVTIDEPLAISELPDRSRNEPNLARKDFSSLKAKYGVDRLMVLDIASAGVWRGYSAYVPTGAPQAVVKGAGFIVDLNTHALDWYQPLDVTQGAEGAWDEPPKFPGVTSAFYAALERSKDEVKRSFAP